MIMIYKGTNLGVPVWAKGFDQDTSVFSMIGVTGLIPQFRKPKNVRKGKLKSFQAQAPKQILALLGNGLLGCSGIE